MSSSDVLKTFSVSDDGGTDKDGKTERTGNGNENVVSVDVGTNVIQVSTGESSHDDLNVGTHLIGDLGEVIFDGAWWAVEDGFELAGALLAGIVDFGSELEGG